MLSFLTFHSYPACGVQYALFGYDFCQEVCVDTGLVSISDNEVVRRDRTGRINLHTLPSTPIGLYRCYWATDRVSVLCSNGSTWNLGNGFLSISVCIDIKDFISGTAEYGH
jgi:hypothetical protein